MSQPDEFPIDDGFLISLPSFTFLLGRGPGALRDPETGRVFAPLWTDFDLFRTWVEGTYGPGEYDVLRLETAEEVRTWLSTFPPTVETLAIDADAERRMTLVPIKGVRIVP